MVFEFCIRGIKICTSIQGNNTQYIYGHILFDDMIWFASTYTELFSTIFICLFWPFFFVVRSFVHFYKRHTHTHTHASSGISATHNPKMTNEINDVSIAWSRERERRIRSTYTMHWTIVDENRTFEFIVSFRAYVVWRSYRMMPQTAILYLICPFRCYSTANDWKKKWTTFLMYQRYHFYALLHAQNHRIFATIVKWRVLTWATHSRNDIKWKRKFVW